MDHSNVLRWVAGGTFDWRSITTAAIRAAQAAGFVTVRRSRLSPHSHADYEERVELTPLGQAMLSANAPTPLAGGRAG